MACAGSVGWRRFGHPIASVMGAMLATAVALEAAGALDARPNGPAAVEERHFSFDLREQPLRAALDAFGAATGAELLYDSAVIGSRRSTAVAGRHTAFEGLSILLSGSGLALRRIAPASFTIEPRSEVRGTAAAAGRPDVGRHAAYFAAVQRQFEAAMCEQRRSAAPLSRMVLRFRVAASGRIEHLERLGPPPGGEADGAMAAVLSRVSQAPPPPDDLPQPVMLLILPASRAACAP